MSNSPQKEWVLPAAIPFADLKRQDLEECVCSVALKYASIKKPPFGVAFFVPRESPLDPHPGMPGYFGSSLISKSRRRTSSSFLITRYFAV
jgi:hypothetical protein